MSFSSLGYLPEPGIESRSPALQTYSLLTGMPGFPVHHQLLQLAQTHVRRVSDAIQTSNPLPPLLLLPSFFPSVRVFSNSLQRRQTDGQHTHKKISNIANYQRNANQNCSEISPHTNQNAHHFKNLQIINTGKGVQNTCPSPTPAACSNSRPSNQ